MAAATSSLASEQTGAALEQLLNGPAGSPPAGTVPNFDNPPQNLIVILYVTAGLSISFTTFAVIIRIYTKRFLLRSLGYEDYTSIIAWISLIGFAIPSLLCQRSGAGTHMWDLRLRSFFRVLYWVNIVAITYAITVTFVKLSLLLQYLRIFVPSRKGNLPLFTAIHACIWSLIIFYLVDTLFLIFLCSPREKIWNPLMDTGHCFDGGGSYKASGVFNVLSDFAILILPMPTIWNLQMSLRRRLLFMGIFATGFFACVTSILRSYYTWQTVESVDTSWELIPMGLWTWAEMSTGIIVGCLPTMPQFFQHIRSKISRSTSEGGPGRDSSAAIRTRKVNVLARIKGPFIKYGVGPSVSDSWNESHSPRTQSYGDYLVLDRLDTSSTRVETSYIESRWPGHGITTVRDDLECGQKGT